MSEAADTEFPGLFCHRTRADWGVSVISGERDGKRTYLFEGGEERVMGSGAHDMMRKLTHLNPEQQSTLARLTALVAGRRGLPASGKAGSAVLLDQLAVLRRPFPRGFRDPEWKNEKRAGAARETAVPLAQELLSLQALDAQLKAQQFDAIWSSVAKVLAGTGFLPGDPLEPSQASGVSLLAGAVRELLHGSANIEQRVDRFSAAFEAAFGRLPRWELTTGLLALVSPDRHVLVDLTSFRKQLKVLGSKGSLPQSPSGAAYMRCVNAARIVASKLTEQGEVPHDLLDVHDFIRFTLKAGAAARRPKAPAKKKSPVVESDTANDSD